MFSRPLPVTAATSAPYVPKHQRTSKPIQFDRTGKLCYHVTAVNQADQTKTIQYIQDAVQQQIDRPKYKHHYVGVEQVSTRECVVYVNTTDDTMRATRCYWALNELGVVIKPRGQGVPVLALLKCHGENFKLETTQKLLQAGVRLRSCSTHPLRTQNFNASAASSRHRKTSTQNASTTAIPCRHGDDCKRPNCFFSHPSDIKRPGHPSDDSSCNPPRASPPEGEVWVYVVESDSKHRVVGESGSGKSWKLDNGRYALKKAEGSAWRWHNETHTNNNTTARHHVGKSDEPAEAEDLMARIVRCPHCGDEMNGRGDDAANLALHYPLCTALPNGRPKCTKGHVMELKTERVMRVSSCDVCHKDVAKDTDVWECRSCSPTWWLCNACCTTRYLSSHATEQARADVMQAECQSEHQQSSDGQGSIQIFVRRDNKTTWKFADPTMTLDVYRADTVLLVKQKIAEVLRRLPVENQRLATLTRTLDDNEAKMADYGIGAESTIYLEAVSAARTRCGFKAIGNDGFPVAGVSVMKDDGVWHWMCPRCGKTCPGDLQNRGWMDCLHPRELEPDTNPTDTVHFDTVDFDTEHDEKQQLAAESITRRMRNISEALERAQLALEAAEQDQAKIHQEIQIQNESENTSAHVTQQAVQQSQEEMKQTEDWARQMKDQITQRVRAAERNLLQAHADKKSEEDAKALTLQERLAKLTTIHDRLHTSHVQVAELSVRLETARKDSCDEEKAKNDMKIRRKAKQARNARLNEERLKRELAELRGQHDTVDAPQSPALAPQTAPVEQAPSEFECPITLDIMRDPVIASDGVTYERAAITDWLAANTTSPCTGDVLVHTHLTPNMALRNLIRSWSARVRGSPPES